MKWADVPDGIKLAAWLTGTALTCVGYIYLNFVTVSASEQQWAQHNQAITCRTVYEIKARVREYLKTLQLQQLTQQQIEWLKTEIAALNEDIKRLDPYGQC